MSAAFDGLEWPATTLVLLVVWLALELHWFGL